ncbi:hypothetical protein Q6A78_07360 [Aliarcobacter skirrowii]|uniref:hypothetical protein n=1 Tax=Aliarcobacter skirrowii TaxID=28200 RepID=UPI0029B99FD4|nr:hypothetical protein [Aliarcobacter skirrowii]MDX3960222.1 hypothetical protein [Aliarcobacter skirrowii]
MTKEMIMTKLFQFSAPTYYKWKKHDKRKIISLLEYAFSDDDLIEYLEHGKISKIEDIGNLDYLLDLSMKFYKFLRHITNYKVAKRVLELLESSFLESNNKIQIDLIAEKIYKEEEFYSSLKLAILNLIQKQEPLVLEYVSKNRVKLENEFSKRASKLIKKSDFLIPSIA